MNYLLSEVFFWIINKLIIFVFILALLVGFYSIYSEYQRYEEGENTRAVLIDDIKEAEARLEILEKENKDKLNKAHSDLQDINRKINSIEINLNDKKLLLHELTKGMGWFITKWIHTDAFWQRKRLENEISILNDSLMFQKRQRTKIDNKINPSLAELRKELESKNKRLNEIDNEFEKDLTHRIIKAVNEQIATALSILIGIIMIPVVLKVLFYYVVAPFAGRRPSIQLLPNTSGKTNTSKGNISSVSLDIKLNPNEELVIRPEYILDLPDHNSNKSTQFFINRSLPFSSISTGLIFLSRITTENSAPIIVSETKNPLMEIGVIEIPEGSALVSHPRSLAGVIHETGKQINITKHWRLLSLQSWLTLQLRYLIIHGPCKLIVKGCRGVRVETAQEARTINQSATLGFSANLNYSNSRCETFVSYWMGKEDLFNDLFHGEQGVYVYEEMPGQHRKSGITGRGLEGFVDSVLKIFGL